MPYSTETLMHAYGEIVPEDREDYTEWLHKAADVQFNFVAAVRWFRTVRRARNRDPPPRPNSISASYTTLAWECRRTRLKRRGGFARLPNRDPPPRPNS